MRTPLIAGNWKMNMTAGEAESFIDSLLNKNEVAGVEAALCVPFIDLPILVERTQKSHVKIGAQNVYFEENGAFTGEISAPMLQELGVDYVIVGHSERRELFHETDEDINKKVRAVMSGSMTPIICVGETEAERSRGQYVGKVEKQVKAALVGVPAEQVRTSVIAYEPIWAIGTGKSATSDDANAMCQSIRRAVENLYDADTAAGVRILYGGSVKPETIEELMAKSDIDGALVGGASLKIEDYVQLLNGAVR